MNFIFLPKNIPIHAPGIAIPPVNILAVLLLKLNCVSNDELHACTETGDHVDLVCEEFPGGSGNVLDVLAVVVVRVGQHLAAIHGVVFGTGCCAALHRVGFGLYEIRGHLVIRYMQ